MGAAVVGMLLGIAGLVFGVVSKNQADELRRDFSLVQDLVEKIQKVEDSSSGISAGATRIRREVDSLRDGTQDALDRVSAELTRVRGDLNESLAMARGLQEKLMGLEKQPEPEPEPEPEPVAAPTEPTTAESAVASGSAADERVNGDSGAVAEEEFYVIRGGDTLSAVASSHGVNLDRLMEANSGVDPLRLQVGQKIRIPAR